MSSKKQEDLYDLAVKLITTIMSNASIEKIGPLNWWLRARTALESGSARSSSFSEMVSLIADKLQIEIFRGESAEKIYLMGKEIEDFEKFRHMCERDSLYIIVEAQALKNIKKKENEK